MKLKIFVVLIFFLEFSFLVSQDSIHVHYDNLIDSSIIKQQKPIFFIGGFGGMSFNFHSADFNKLPGYPNCCPQFTSGFGMGYTMGISLEFPLNDNWSLGSRLSLSSMGGVLSKEQTIGNTEIRNPVPPFETQNITDAQSKFEIDSHIEFLAFEPNIIYTFQDSFFVDAGMRFSFMHKTIFDQKEELISPDNIVFKETETRTRNQFRSQEIPDQSSIQYHAFIGAGYKYFIRTSLVIVPELRYYHSLSKLSTVDWSINQLQLSLSFLFHIYKKRELKTLKEEFFIRDTSVIEIVGLKTASVSLTSSDKEVKIERLDEFTKIERTTYTEKYEKRIPKETTLIASIVAVGINKDGTETPNPTIIIEETEIDETFPILPYVFFEENSSQLESSSMKILNKFITQDFDETQLPQNTLEIYNNMLNIIGSRLKNNPNTDITITGNNNNNAQEKNNLVLSEERAKSVKQYLVDVWEIKPERIKINSRNLPAKSANNDIIEGLEENRRAEISSGSYEIIKPVTIKEYSKTSNPPIVKITPIITSDVGIKHWDMSIQQNKKLLRSYDNKNDDIKWLIEKEPIPVLEQPVEISLNVSDVTDKKINTVKTLEIKQMTIKKKRVEMKDDKRIEKFSLILFDYNRAELKSEHKIILEEIKQRITPESIVSISGFADRTGEAEYNKELAAKRTSNVIKELGISPESVTINNIGSDELLYDNDTPQGRSYCRTVRIEIETPVREE